FIESLLNCKSPTINGDGKHSRDFTYVSNAVEANILSLFTNNTNAFNQVYNIACGEQTSLLQLAHQLKQISAMNIDPIHVAERNGDVKHSLADISKAKDLLGYDPKVSFEEGLKKTFEWYQKQGEIKI